MNLTDALMRASGLHEKHIATWSIIRGEIDRLLPLRNELAHNPYISTGRFIIKIDKNKNTSELVEHERWHEIRTEPLKLLRRKAQTESHTISAKDLRKYLTDLRVLERAIDVLKRRLLGKPPGLNLEYPEPDFPLRSAPKKNPDSKPKPLKS